MAYVGESNIKCSKCKEPIHNLSNVCIMVDENKKPIIVCKDCANKSDDRYKLLLSGLEDGKWVWAILILAILNKEVI